MGQYRQFLLDPLDPVSPSTSYPFGKRAGLRGRQTNESAVCQPDECDSSLIPLNNTIVVPGGRYREIYYWDSYWVLQGLLKSELYDYANALVTNFMDFIRVSRHMIRLLEAD
jgi:neutral trehalase